MSTPADLILDIDEITVEAVSPEEAAHLRAVIERAIALAARSLAAEGSAVGPDFRTDVLRLDLENARGLTAPGADNALAQRLETAIRAAWESAG